MLNKEEIKKALDHFEDDKFTDAKEILQSEIKKAKDEYFNDKLGLKKGDKEEQED
jgi:hypothetical protein